MKTRGEELIGDVQCARPAHAGVQNVEAFAGKSQRSCDEVSAGRLEKTAPHTAINQQPDVFGSDAGRGKRFSAGFMDQRVGTLARFAVAQETRVGPAAVQYKSQTAKIAIELFWGTVGIQFCNLRQHVLIRDFAGRNPDSNRADSHGIRLTGLLLHEGTPIRMRLSRTVSSAPGGQNPP